MSKTKKEDRQEMPRPAEDVKVEKPVFKDTLAKMIKKKPADTHKKEDKKMN